MSVRLLMIWFDYQFKRLINQLDINAIMYYWYIDDMEALVERLNGMVRFNKDSKSLVNKEPNSDEHMSDKQMINLLHHILDSIGYMIKGEVDKYNDKQIMILAMKVMMDREDNKVSVKFRFYQKHMDNKTVVSAYNSVPIRMVFNTPINEVMRRMRNTSPSLLPDENR